MIRCASCPHSHHPNSVCTGRSGGTAYQCMCTCPHARKETADTITDEQVSALRDEASRGGDEYLFAYCTAALFVVPSRTQDRAFRLQRRANARARLAEILNGRAKAAAE